MFLCCDSLSLTCLARKLPAMSKLFFSAREEQTRSTADGAYCMAFAVSIWRTIEIPPGEQVRVIQIPPEKTCAQERYRTDPSQQTRVQELHTTDVARKKTCVQEPCLVDPTRQPRFTPCRQYKSGSVFPERARSSSNEDVICPMPMCNQG